MIIGVAAYNITMALHLNASSIHFSLRRRGSLPVSHESISGRAAITYLDAAWQISSVSLAFFTGIHLFDVTSPMRSHAT